MTYKLRLKHDLYHVCTLQVGWLVHPHRAPHATEDAPRFARVAPANASAGTDSALQSSS